MRRAFLAALLLTAFGHGPAAAQESDADLAKRLANPVASLISVPDRVYATSPDGGPDWGARAVATFLFPKK